MVDHFLEKIEKVKLNLLGIQLHAVSVHSLHAFLGEFIARKQKAIVLHLNIHGASLAWRSPEFMHFLNRAALVFCDGDGIRWAAKILGLPVPIKITYDRWIWQLAEWCQVKGHRLYLLGAKPGVAEKAADRLVKKFPELKIAGTHHGHFDHSGIENQQVVDLINQSGADILLVGFGMPLQEEWISENCEKLNVSIFLAGGAVFDYASGRAKRAPDWMIRWNLEWLYRLIQEPERLGKRYFSEIPFFFFNVFKAKLKYEK